MIVKCKPTCRRDRRVGRYVRVFLAVTFLAGVGAIGLSSCSVLSTPTPERSPEEALVAFMLDYTVRNEIEPMIEIIEKEDIPLIESPPEAFIIVWEPLTRDETQAPWNWLDRENPNQVWTYRKGQVTMEEDGRAAIQSYRQKFIENRPAMPSIFTWGYYEFGIISLSEDGKRAEVLYTAWCGYACGHGILFTLERDHAGDWAIIGMVPLGGS